MRNTPSLARTWTEFIAVRPEFKYGEALLQQFNAGDITRLCDCGCSSYDFKLHPGANVPSLAPPAERGGCVFELEFQTEEWGKTVSFSLLDSDGNLSGLEVDYCANSFPMPESPRLSEPPFHVHGMLAHEAQPGGQPDLAHKAAQGLLP